MNVLALTFSTICTIWVGRWSAQRENRAFIRAALRTTYGLHEGLGVAEQSALQAVSRMKNRQELSTVVASQFWEEVIGRVLDHLRGLMREAQATICKLARVWAGGGGEVSDCGARKGNSDRLIDSSRGRGASGSA